MQTLVEPEKFRSVSCWLQDAFHSEEPPAFEINTDTLGILSKLSAINTERDEEYEQLIQDANQRAQWYKREGDKLEQILSCGLRQQTLSTTGAKHLEILVSLAQTLELRDVTPSSYYEGLLQMEQRQRSITQQREEEKDNTDQILAKTGPAIAKLNEICKTLEQCAHSSGEQNKLMMERLSEIRYLQNKSKEYMSTIQKLKEDIANSGITPELTHSAIVKAHRALEEIRIQLEPIRATLRTYNDLPPDPRLAQVKLEGVRNKIARCEELLAHKMKEMSG